MNGPQDKHLVNKSFINDKFECISSTTGGSKRDIMKAFGQGVSKHGVEVSYVEQHNI